MSKSVAVTDYSHEIFILILTTVHYKEFHSKKSVVVFKHTNNAFNSNNLT